MAVDLDVVNAVRQHVRSEIIQQQRYFRQQLRRYRWARITVIVSAAAIPVLTPIDAVPKWVLGLLGALAAVTESLIQLYRWRDSAVAAQRLANALETELTAFQTRTPPYEGPLERAFAAFVAATEKVHIAGVDAFAGLWSEDRPPSAQAPPTATPADASAH